MTVTILIWNWDRRQLFLPNLVPAADVTSISITSFVKNKMDSQIACWSDTYNWRTLSGKPFSSVAQPVSGNEVVGKESKNFKPYCSQECVIGQSI